MPMHIEELIACIIFLYMKIFICLIKQACLLAIISIFLGGGVDDSILWLSFAQQKLAKLGKISFHNMHPPEPIADFHAVSKILEVGPTVQWFSTLSFSVCLFAL
jgi:hypothetical protein